MSILLAASTVMVEQWRGGLSVTGGGANTQTAAAPPPLPHAHTHKHTCCLSVRISYIVTGADAGFWRGGGGGGEVGSTWKIDASPTRRGAREARENFCGARSNFSTDCIGN